MSIKVSIEYAPKIRGTKVYIYDEKDNGSIDVYEPTELVVRHIEKPWAEDINPTFNFPARVGHEFLNQLCNALVVAGFKPDEIKAKNSEVEAIKYHLEDMRNLVFNERNK